MQLKKDRATELFRKIKDEKNPRATWEHIKNEQWKSELAQKALEEVEKVQTSPDYALDWIKWKT